MLDRRWNFLGNSGQRVWDSFREKRKVVEILSPFDHKKG